MAGGVVSMAAQPDKRASPASSQRVRLANFPAKGTQEKLISEMKYNENSFCPERHKRDKYFNITICTKLSHRLYQIGDEPECTGHKLVELMMQNQAGVGMPSLADRGERPGGEKFALNQSGET